MFQKKENHCIALVHIKEAYTIAKKQHRNGWKWDERTPEENINDNKFKVTKKDQYKI